MHSIFDDAFSLTLKNFLSRRCLMKTFPVNIVFRGCAQLLLHRYLTATSYSVVCYNKFMRAVIASELTNPRRANSHEQYFNAHYRRIRVFSILRLVYNL